MNIIDLYISNMRKEDIINFALKNNITLNTQELDFIYNLIKNHYKELIQKKDTFNLSVYKNHLSEENYPKIESLIRKYLTYL